MNPRVLVTGDRDWPFYWTIWRRLRRLRGRPVIIYGGVRGADFHAGRAARSLGYESVCLAHWAGYDYVIRNAEMVALGPDLGLVFHPDPGVSRDICDCVRRMNVRRLPVEVISR